MSTWREQYAPIIATVLDVGMQLDGSETLIRRKLREAKPSSARAAWPGRVWRDEVKRQMGLIPRGRAGHRRKIIKAIEEAKQMVLF